MDQEEDEVITGHTSNTNRVTARIDPSTHTMQSIGYAHHEIHNGSMYTALTFKDPVTSGEYLAIGWNTPADPDGPLMHVVVEWAAEQEMHVTYLKGPTLTPGAGTPITGNNHRLSMSNDSTIVSLTSYDNNGAAGGIIFDRGDTWSNRSQTAGRRDAEEWICAPGVSYAIKGTAGANGGLLIKLMYYWHTDKETIE